MSKIFFRAVAFVLVSCLIADPALTSGFSSLGFPGSASKALIGRQEASVIETQALSPVAREVLPALFPTSGWQQKRMESGMLRAFLLVKPFLIVAVIAQAIHLLQSHLGFPSFDGSHAIVMGISAMMHRSIHHVAHSHSPAFDENRQRAALDIEKLEKLDGFADHKNEGYVVLRQILDKLLKAENLDPAEFKFDVLETDTPNAFIYPYSQHVFITRGLLREITMNRNSPSQDMVAFILAHEISHYILGQYEQLEPSTTSKKEEERGRKSFYEMSMLEIGKHVFNFSQEYRCDLNALRIMDRAGYNVMEAERSLGMIAQMERQAELDAKKDVSTDATEGGSYNRGYSVPSIFTTHPHTSRRIQAVQTLVWQSPWRNDQAALTELPRLEIETLLAPGHHEIFISKLESVTSLDDLAQMAEKAADSRSIEELLAIYIGVESMANRKPAKYRDEDGKIKIDKSDSTGLLYLNLKQIYENLTDKNDVDDDPGWIEFARRFFGEGKNDNFGARLDLFEPWQDLKRTGREKTEKFLKQPFYRNLVRRFDALANQGVEHWRHENPSVQGLQRDIAEWLTFYSYFPTQEGLLRLNHILSQLRSVEDLNQALEQLPLKVFNLPFWNKQISDTKSSGFGYPRFEVLLARFLEAGAEALRENGGFSSDREETAYLVAKQKEWEKRISHYHLWLSTPLRHLLATQWGRVNSKEEFLEWVESAKALQGLDEINIFFERVDVDPSETLLGLRVVKKALAKKWLGHTPEEDVQILDSIMPTAVSDRDDCLQLLVEHYKASPAILSAISTRVFDPTRFADLIQRALKAAQPKPQTFEEHIRFALRFGIVYPKKTLDTLAQDSAKSLDDIRKGLQLLRDFSETLPDKRRTAIEPAIDAVEALGYKRAIESDAVGPTCEARLEAALEWFSPGEARDNQLLTILREDGPTLSDFLFVRDQFGWRNEDDVTQNLWKSYRPEAEKIGKKVNKVYRRLQHNPLGIAQRTSPKPFDPRQTAADHTLQLKTEAGDIAFLWAQKEGYFKGLSFEQQSARLQTIFPEKSGQRDARLLELLSETHSPSIADFRLAVSLLASPLERLSLGRRGYAALMAAQGPALKTDLASHLRELLLFYPDFTVERDDLLAHLINDQSKTEAEVEELIGYLTLNRPPSIDAGVLFTEAALETYRDKAAELTPRDKAEVILWTLGLRAKPIAIQAVEEGTGYGIENINEKMQGATATEKRLFLEELLGGEDGLFLAGDSKAERFLLDSLFVLMIPHGEENSPGIRKLKALYDEIFLRTNAAKKTELVIRMALARSEHKTLPQIVCDFLNAYGVIGVKVAQFLASRTQILPKDMRDALVRLTNQADPFAKQDVFETVRQTFDRSPGELFPEIGERKGAASIKQVHQVLLSNGKRAILKVLRPAVPKEVRRQLVVLSHVVDMVHAHPDVFGVRLPDGMVGEIQRLMKDELNFELEAKNQKELRKRVAKRWPKPNGDGYRVFVPAIISQYSKGAVITEEEVTGSALEDLDKAGVDTVPAKRTILKELFAQIFEDGFFHADPHQGNILVDPEKHTIGFIDAGAVGTLSAVNRARVLDLVLIFHTKNREALERWLLELWLAMPEAQRPALSQGALQSAAEQLLHQPAGADAMGDFLYGMVSTVNDLKIQIPDEFYLLVKVLGSVDYLLKGLQDAPGYIETLMTPYVAAHMNAVMRGHQEGRPTPSVLDAAFAALPAALAAPVATAAVEKKSEVGVVPALWKIDQLPVGTKIRWTSRYPDAVFTVGAQRELADGLNIKVLENPQGFKGFMLLPKTKNEIEVSYEGNDQWVYLKDLQVSPGQQTPIHLELLSPSPHAHHALSTAA